MITWEIATRVTNLILMQRWKNLKPKIYLILKSVEEWHFTSAKMIINDVNIRFLFGHVILRRPGSTTEMCDRLRRLCYIVKYFFGNDRQNDRHMRHNNFLRFFFFKKIKLNILIVRPLKIIFRGVFLPALQVYLGSQLGFLL